ncbi:MAG: hypothetical protein ABSA49_19745 [Rhizomicrobium sp.]|jgi:hypothetical protein
MRRLSDVIYNFHWIVAGKAARASQAYAGFLRAFLRARAIRSVINLRGPNPKHMWWRYETRICAELGVAHFDTMLSSRRLPTQQMLINLLEAFRQAQTPVLLKCSGGQDRTSFAAALYLLNAQGWAAFEEAEQQFASWPYLHWPRRHQHWLKLFPEFAREDSAGAALAEWLGRDYTPERFKAWLEARGMGDSFRGLYDKPGTAPGI